MQGKAKARQNTAVTYRSVCYCVTCYTFCNKSCTSSVSNASSSSSSSSSLLLPYASSFCISFTLVNTSCSCTVFVKCVLLIYPLLLYASVQPLHHSTFEILSCLSKTIRSISVPLPCTCDIAVVALLFSISAATTVEVAAIVLLVGEEKGSLIPRLVVITAGCLLGKGTITVFVIAAVAAPDSDDCCSGDGNTDISSAVMTDGVAEIVVAWTLLHKNDMLCIASPAVVYVDVVLTSSVVFVLVFSLPSFFVCVDALPLIIVVFVLTASRVVGAGFSPYDTGRDGRHAEVVAAGCVLVCSFCIGHVGGLVRSVRCPVNPRKGAAVSATLLAASTNFAAVIFYPVSSAAWS
uniref:Uncharacterized protein n=1 Tax=Lygus hesperus TaxID=30085 RepID=A0A0A9XZS0_LYGHE